MVAPPLSTLHLKSSPAAPLFRFASSPRPLVPRLRGFLRPGASRSPLGAPPLSFKSRMQPESSTARSLRWTLPRTSRTVVRWSLSASSPSHSAATWPGMVLSTSSPSPTCSRSLATLSFPPASHRKADRTSWKRLAHIVHHRWWRGYSSQPLVCGEYLAPRSPRDSQCSAALPRHDLCANRSYSTILSQPKLKGDQTMKKFLSIFVALAMVLSLFAGIGARSVKAATTLTLTPSGNFSGGVAGSGTTAVDAVGTIAAITGGVYTVSVTTAGVGIFDTGANVSVTNKISTTVTSVDPDWKTPGDQSITFTGTPLPVVDDEVTVAAGTTNGVGNILTITGTAALVRVTTAAVGTLTGALTVMRANPLITATSTDPGWNSTGNGKTIAFTPVAGMLAVGDRVQVSMVQLQAGVAAKAFLTIGGGISAGNVAVVTWQDTTGASHTASYTVLSGDNFTTVTTGLMNAINALAGGLVSATSPYAYVIQLTQNVAGVAGNGKTLTAGADANALTIHTLGGLVSPVYVEVGKTLQLVAVDQTGAVTAPVWMCTSGSASVVLGTTGLVTATAVTGAAMITATLANGTVGQLVVLVILPQTIATLAVKLVPTALKVAGQQQFGAIAGNATYSALDYTTQAAWTDTLPVASIAATTGLLTYGADETGNVTAYAASLTAVAAVKIAAGVVTIAPVVAPVKRVIVLTVGTDIVTVDGKATSVDAAPEIVAHRTVVPVRVIAETFGSTLAWIAATKIITITLGTTTIGLH